MKLSVCWRCTHACHDAPMDTRTDTNFELVIAFILKCQPIPQISLKIKFHTAIFIRHDIIPGHYTAFFFFFSLKKSFTIVYIMKRHPKIPPVYRTHYNYDPCPLSSMYHKRNKSNIMWHWTEVAPKMYTCIARNI